MDHASILTHHRSAVIACAAKRRAANPRLFGSVLRGQATALSDFDILVDPLPGATLFDLGGLQADLEDLLGVRVDLLTPEDIAPEFREQIVAEARPI